MRGIAAGAGGNAIDMGAQIASHGVMPRIGRSPPSPPWAQSKSETAATAAPIAAGPPAAAACADWTTVLARNASPTSAITKRRRRGMPQAYARTIGGSMPDTRF
jgi:hypothetical protein